MSGWFLREIAIEGFRGINNDGDAFRLKLKPEKVNSISAPNGVGKSSIYDAVTYALTGEIPKLDSLPSAERGESYYLNRFHSGPHGTIVMTLAPAAGGDDGGLAGEIEGGVHVSQTLFVIPAKAGIPLLLLAPPPPEEAGSPPSRG